MGGVSEPDFGYVVLVTAAAYVIHQWMAVKVGQARRKYNVPYPTMYADEATNKNAKVFNCVQRGHQNCLESLPMFLSMLILGGTMYPMWAAAFGVVYLVGRTVYFLSYSTGDPNARLRGMFYALGLISLLVLNIVVGVQLLKSGILSGSA